MNLLLPIFISLTNIAWYWVSGERLVELNHDFNNENTRTWPAKGLRHFLLSPITHGFDSNGLWISMFNYEGTEHSGTHMDAPSHFHQTGWTVDQIPLSHLFAPAVVIDIREKVKRNPMAALSVDDITKWVQDHGSLPNNSVILVLTGWESKYNDSQAYYGIQGDSKVLPGIELEAAKELLTFRNQSIVGVGIDSPSIDVGSSVLYETHRELFAVNVYALENLKNIDKLPPIGADLVIMPMKIKGGSGAPCRVIAKIPDIVHRD